MIENVIYAALFDAVEEMGTSILVAYVVAVILLLVTCHFTVVKFFRGLGYFRLRLTIVTLFGLMGASLSTYMNAIDSSASRELLPQAVQKRWILFGSYGIGEDFVKAIKPLASGMQDIFSGSLLCLVFNFSIGLTLAIIGWILFAMLIGWKTWMIALALDLLINWKQGKWTKKAVENAKEEEDRDSTTSEAEQTELSTEAKSD
ncbi:hypothetical protein SAMN02910400_00845 [Lachnospiraceae bacterium C10]|nr:hypothetical protein SAMN02910400_00845 [Lachnospiraceae bacterium C10]